MAAAVVTKLTKFNLQHVMPAIIGFYKTTTSDWLVTNSSATPFKGFLPLGGWDFSATASTTMVGMDFATCTINNAGTAYAATTTSIVIQSVTPVATRVTPYYLLTQDASTTAFEILEVTADSAPSSAGSTLTVKRGCLGTTAMVAGVANNSMCFFLNVIVLSDAQIGNCMVLGLGLPEEPKAPVFGTAQR